MSLTKTTQFANRYGLNIEIFAHTDTTMESPLMTIDFANVSEVNISGDRTWATGGQDHTNKIGFNDPLQGTLKLSTQIMTMELLALMAGNDLNGAATSIVFENTANSAPKYYIIKAETVWQDADGQTYSETLTFHKACPKRAFNISYNGEGDPTSTDIEFDLMQNSDGKVMTVTKT